MAKKTYSREDLFGDIHHYDEKGRKTGVSRRGVLGGYTDYDAKGKVTGRTEEDLLGGGLTHYDKKGRVTGRSREQLFGDYAEYDAKGAPTGTRRRSVLDADPRRLETTGSVYRRSIDPPPFLDDSPAQSETNAPADPLRRPEPSDAPGGSGERKGGSVFAYILASAAVMFFVLFLAAHC